MEGMVEVYARYAEDDVVERASAHTNRLHNKLAMTVATSVVGPLYSLAKVTEKSVIGLTSNAATQLANLDRRVEELSRQLTSVALRHRQQQGLLERVWEKVSPPTPHPRAAPPQPPLG